MSRKHDDHQQRIGATPEASLRSGNACLKGENLCKLNEMLSTIWLIHHAFHDLMSANNTFAPEKIEFFVKNVLRNHKNA